MSLAVALLTAGLAAQGPASLNTPLMEELVAGAAWHAAQASTGAAARVAVQVSCAPAAVLSTAQPADARPGPTPLAKLPPARQYLAVLREERGCQVAVVKEDGRNVVVPLGPQLGLQPLQADRTSR